MTTRRDFLRSKSHDPGVGVGDDGGGDGNDDDDSDTLTELSFSRSPTSSLGRSSTGSIPWAEDAVRQNQLEWERIERMFYGEEDLPTDNKLREEFLEWMVAFPHVRVLGRAMPIGESATARCSDPFHEEVYAIDPPRASRIRSSRSGKTGGKESGDFHQHQQHQLVPTDIERYLHISSGGRQIMRNNHRNAKELVKNASDPTTIISYVETAVVDKVPQQQHQQKASSNNLIIPPSANQSFGILISNNYNYLTSSNDLSSLSRNSSAQSVTRFNNSIMHKRLAPLGQRPQPKAFAPQQEKPILSSSASATNGSRIPPLTSSNIKFIVRNSHVLPNGSNQDSDLEAARHAKFNMVKSATSSRYPLLSPTKNIITLPSLLVDERGGGGTIPRRGSTRKIDFSTEIVGRSISAAVTHHQHQQQLQKSAQSLKPSGGNGNGGNTTTSSAAPKLNVIHYH